MTCMLECFPGTQAVLNRGWRLLPPKIVTDFSRLRKFYCPEGAYGNSKAAQVLFTKYLDAQLNAQDGEERCNIRVHSVHPGVVNTGLYVHARHITVSTG